MDIYTDYANWKFENHEFIHNLVERKSVTISRFTSVIVVVDYLYDKYTKKNKLSEAHFNATTGYENINIISIKEKDLKIDELAKSNDDVDGLKNKIIELQSLNEKQQLDLRQSQIDNAVKIALINSKAKNLTAVKSLLNLENAELEGDVVKGLEKQIEELKKSDAYLFNEESKTVLKGITPAEAQPNSTNSKPLEKMSYEELCAFMEANPNVDINVNNK